MFDPEKLVRGMLSQAIGGGFRGSKRRSSTTFGVGNTAILTSLLGVGIAAFEHFTKGSNSQQPIPQNSGMPPPPPPSSGSFGASPPPPPSSSASATVMIRAMIAAAHADGHLDQAERAELRKTLLRSDLSAEDRRFLENLFDTPPSINEIVSEVKTPQQAEQVYTVSVLSITVDSELERNYLQSLATALRLSPDQVHRIHRELSGNDELQGNEEIL